MLGRGTRFEVACRHCPMRLVLDRIRDTDAAVMSEHLQGHPDLGVSATAALGSILDHFRVTPTAWSLATRLEPAPATRRRGLDHPGMLWVCE